VFIVELRTTAGTVSESYPTYEEALQRVESFPAESLMGLPLIFRELADGSQRLVRGDGKPLQWHRLPEETDLLPGPDEPLPLCDDPDSQLGESRWTALPQPTPQDDQWDESMP